MKTTLLSLLLIITLFTAVVPFFAYAQQPAPVDPQGLGAGFTRVNTFLGRTGIRDFGTPQSFVFRMLRLVLSFLSVIAIIVIIIGGIMYIMALGDEKKSAAAKHTILYAVIGLLIIAVSGIIVNVVIALFFTNAVP